MFLRLLRLDVKSFFRAPSFALNLFIKIISILSLLIFALMAVGYGIGYFYICVESGLDPITTLCRYALYAWGIDISLRILLQKLNSQNIKPFLTHVSKKTLSAYTIFRSLYFFLNWLFVLFLIPLTISLYSQGYKLFDLIGLNLALLSLIYINNFTIVIANIKDAYLNYLLGIIVIVSALEYFSIIEITAFTEKLMMVFYNRPLSALVPVLILVGLIRYAYNLIIDYLYLDEALSQKESKIRLTNLDLLDRFGKVGFFLKNDLRLLLRNKYPRGVFYSGFLFLFYGFLFSVDIYNNNYMFFFLGSMVTGGFLQQFGSKVPAWESSYYPLLMTQNVSYKEYLRSKWWLMVVLTLFAMICCVIYIPFGWEMYWVFLATGVYNLGVNTHLTLYIGAYMKVPIDLNRAQKRAGQKNAFNWRTLIIGIPKFVLPFVIYSGLIFWTSHTIAILGIIILGLIGFFFRELVFNLIEETYKEEKYKTIEAFKTKAG